MVEMSSLPFSSLGSGAPTLRKHDISSTSTPMIRKLLLPTRNFRTTEEARVVVKAWSTKSSNHHKTTSSSSSSSSSSSCQFHLLELKEISAESSSFRRREAIGIGLCLGPLGFVDALAEATAASAEATCDFTIATSGLAYCDKLVGTGPQAVKGQLIKAHYVGKLENGKVFDSSYNRGKPLTFRIGVGEVIKGWDQGILGGDGVPPMLAGGKRTLKLPPQLGYGMRGAGCNGGSCIIPPNSVLLFDVEFIGKT